MDCAFRLQQNVAFRHASLFVFIALTLRTYEPMLLGSKRQLAPTYKKREMTTERKAREEGRGGGICPHFPLPKGGRCNGLNIDTPLIKGRGRSFPVSFPKYLSCG